MRGWSRASRRHVAGRGAQGAGRRRAHLRADDAKGGDGFDQYADTRSQVYGGVTAETGDVGRRGRRDQGPDRDLPGRAGRDLLLLDLRRAHRGRREHGLGAEPLPWLRSVDDPYDDVSPQATAGARSG